MCVWVCCAFQAEDYMYVRMNTNLLDKTKALKQAANIPVEWCENVEVDEDWEDAWQEARVTENTGFAANQSNHTQAATRRDTAAATRMAGRQQHSRSSMRQQRIYSDEDEDEPHAAATAPTAAGDGPGPVTASTRSGRQVVAPRTLDSYWTS